MDEQKLNQMLAYYGDDDNILKILPFLYKREIVLLNKGEQIRYNEVRNIRVHELKNFQLNIIWRIRQNRCLYNIYYSLAVYKNGVPLFNFMGYSDEEKTALKQSWREDYWKSIISYDWLIDMDCKNSKELPICAEDTIKICVNLDKKDINYSIRFSGCGFQIIIPYESIPNYKKFDFNPFSKSNIYMHCNKLNKKYYDKIGESVDYIINDARRIIKVPNTLVYNPEKTKENLMICKIISKEELKNFDYKRYIYDFPKIN